MKVPFIDFKAHHRASRSEILSALRRVVDGGAYILGEEVARFEERIAAYCGSRFAIGVSSGTDALLVALMAMDVGPGDEIITSPYSFFATAGVVARLGAVPVFVDIDPKHYNLDPKLIESAITAKTKGILPVHLYGQTAEMAPILALAKRRGLFVIEDAAQALGARYRDGRCAGTMGQLGCFSFFPTKNLGAMGDAGMVVTDDPALAQRVRTLRVHGSQPKYYHGMIGGNFRLDALQAAVLNVKLDQLNRWSLRRRQNAQRYRRLFKEQGLSPDDLALPQEAYACSKAKRHHIYNQFIVRSPERDALKRALGQAGVSVEVYYPVALHRQRCFASLGYNEGSLPQSERAAKETLALPIYPELTERQQAHVMSTIAKFLTDKR